MHNKNLVKHKLWQSQQILLDLWWSVTQLKIIYYNMHEQMVEMKGKCCQNFLLNLWAFVLRNYHATLNDDSKGLSQSHSQNICLFPKLCLYYHYFAIYIQSN